MPKRSLMYLGLLLAGCTTISSLSQRGALVLQPEISAGQYGTKTVVSPYTQNDIHHLVLKLFTYDGAEHDQGIQRTLLNPQLGNPIVFSNLKPNTTYRIKAYAYFDAGETTLISVDASPSYTDVVLTNDDRPSVATLSVKLIDKAFNGQATSSIAIVNGGYSPIASESLKFPFYGIVTTYAGSSTTGGTDGFRLGATFSCPRSVLVSPSGYLYVLEDGGHRIRRIDPSGFVTTFAGGNVGFTNGQGTAACFSNIFAMAMDATGNLYVSDYGNNAIRKIDSSANVTTLAGNGTIGATDGTGANATFHQPLGVCVDSSGNVYVADSCNYKIRKITPAGVVTTFAGSGVADFVDGSGTMARFNFFHGVASDAQDNIYVADSSNNRIRKVTPAGVVSTLAGTAAAGTADGTGAQATLNSPVGITVRSDGDVYFSDRGSHRIRKVTQTGVVTTIAGNGTASTVNGTGAQASFNLPEGLAFDAYGNLFVVEYGSNTVRMIQ